jgi:Putative metallopeptidase
VRSYWIGRALVVAASLFAVASSGAAERKPQFKANRIEVRYTEPESPDQQAVFKLLMERHALEKLRHMLNPIKLPRTLVLQTRSCQGQVNAWYDGKTVSVCYELIDEIWKNAPDKTTPAGIAPIDTMIGPFVHVFLHETGHALFDLLNMPVLGREEDAADQFATYFMLQFDNDEARRLIGGSAYQYKTEISSPTVTMALQQFSDEHGTAEQRFYNLLCMAYGSDQKLFGDLVSSGYLPKRRAEICPVEYAKVANAFAALLGPYLDLKLAAKQPKRWLAPIDTKPPLWRSP